MGKEQLIQRVVDNMFEYGRDWWYTEGALAVAELFDPATSTSLLEQAYASLRVWDEREHMPEDIVEENKEILKCLGILGERK